MALLLPKSAFIHIPKCGGSSVRESLREAGYSVHKEDESGNPDTPFNRRAHARPHECGDFLSGKFTFTFIREPVGWYRSYWCHRTYTAWTLFQFPEEREAWYYGVSFCVWVERITSLHPGFLTRIYREYTTGVDFVGRTENLEDDLNRALTLAGEEITQIKLVTANQSRIPRPEVAPKVESLILGSEHALKASTRTSV